MLSCRRVGHVFLLTLNSPHKSPLIPLSYIQMFIYYFKHVRIFFSLMGGVMPLPSMSTSINR